jgi:two-component system, OmpR family, phosphate regulon response regulator PhoB
MKKILIVDDREEIRDLVEKTLRRNNCTILKADCGEKALEIAKAERPDLIMMDIMMPGTIDGFEAIRRLKEDPVTRNCRVIILTARGQSTDVKRGTELGADDYFVKPFSPLELMRKVDEVLGT